eukprot:366007-Chlamydomonas_euryale.AAC.12
MPLPATPKHVGRWSNCGGQNGEQRLCKSLQEGQPAWPSRAACKSTAQQHARGAHVHPWHA